MAKWRPDWRLLMETAPNFEVEAKSGFVYLVADSHLGDARSPVEDFLAMLERLGDAALVVFMGDLFKVWLALPKFWDDQVRALLAGFERLRAGGVPIWFVVGNREYFLPKTSGITQSGLQSGLPFDRIVHEAAVMEWAGRRYGLTHGDLVNREDAQYLKWRRLSRSWPMEAAFRALPGAVARRIATGLERSLANTNQEIKIAYPLHELQAFAAEAMRGLDGYFIGHFHKEAEIRPTGSGAEDGTAVLRIVPDWFSARRVLRLDGEGRVEALDFS